jgi:hypothetical protein
MKEGKRWKKVIKKREMKMRNKAQQTKLKGNRSMKQSTELQKRELGEANNRN